MNKWSHGPRFLFPALLLLCLAGCAISTGSGDAQRRKNLVMVPQDAGVVSSIRWSDMRNLRPLNERMILLEVQRRPHLLVLAERCRGLHRRSVFVFDRRNARFSPQHDAIGVFDPTMGGVTSTCVPDTLYAIRDEDVEELLASL